MSGTFQKIWEKVRIGLDLASVWNLIGSIAGSALVLGWARQYWTWWTAQDPVAQVLIGLGVGLLIFLLLAKLIGSIGRKGNATGSRVTPIWIQATDAVIGRRFFNETIEIDGKRFIDCKFENVVLFFRGVGNYEFIRMSSKGTIGLKTDNKAATAFVNLIHFMETIPGVEIAVKGTIDEAGEITPLVGAKVNPPIEDKKKEP